MDLFLNCTFGDPSFILSSTSRKEYFERPSSFFTSIKVTSYFWLVKIYLDSSITIFIVFSPLFIKHFISFPN